MSRGLVQFIQLVVVFTIFWHNAPSSALHVELEPKVVHEVITNEVNITCLANDSPYWSNNVILMSMGISGNNPLATLSKGHPVQYGVDRKSNMEAYGLIEKNENAKKSFLRLTIKNPSVEDSGLYTCQLHYLDGHGLLKRGESSANLTVQKNNDKVLLNHLMNTVSNLKGVVAQKSKKINDLEIKLKHQENLVASQGRQLKDQQKRIEGLSTEDGKTNSDFTNLRKQVSDLRTVVISHNKILEAQGQKPEGNHLYI